MLYKKQSPTNSARAWEALLYSIGAKKTVPYVAGRRVTATLDFANTNAQTSSEKTIACPGANIGDMVIVGSTVNPANSCWTGLVATADIVTVRFNNYSSGAINPASGTFLVTVIPTL